MKINLKHPGRCYIVGKNDQVIITDCGTIELVPDEQVTFVSHEGAEYDLVAKDFGYYATPSTNGRLASFGLKTVLVKNSIGRVFVLLVHTTKLAEFLKYVDIEGLEILGWLDDEEFIAGLSKPATVQNA
jgi:hypothetical protein